MAQSSAAREPSMEEILASIRRIIESNEPGAGSAISDPFQPGYDEQAAAAPNDYGRVDDQFGTSRSPIAPPARVPAPANQSSSDLSSPLEEKALSLADVAARVRAANERGDAASPGLPENSPSFGDQSASATPRLAELRTVQTPRNEPLFAARPSTSFNETPEAVSKPEIMVTLETVVPPASEVSELSDDDFELDIPMSPEDFEDNGTNDAGSALAALMSAEAGAQVSRSFKELAEAIDGAERRSLDEIAEDMLRPMLREWLDDNLPTLVEKLVREEIERVARGPRR